MRRRGLFRNKGGEVGKTIEETTLINDPALRTYYQFLGNGNDYFGNYNAITANNVGYNSGGKFGRSATFNRVNSSYFRLPDSVTYNLTQTISFWGSISENGPLFGKGSDTSDGWGVSFGASNSPTVFNFNIVGVKSNGVAVGYLKSFTPSNFEFSKFNHYCMVIDFEANEMILYINGEESILYNFGTEPIRLRGTTDVYIGSSKPGTTFQHFTGEISDWGLFERRLTNSEIQHLALGNPIA